MEIKKVCSKTNVKLQDHKNFLFISHGEKRMSKEISSVLSLDKLVFDRIKRTDMKNENEMEIELQVIINRK